MSCGEVDRPQSSKVFFCEGKMQCLLLPWMDQERMSGSYSWLGCPHLQGNCETLHFDLLLVID